MALSFKELCEKFGYKQPAALARHLKAKGIKFLPDAKGRPMTTEEAINRALFKPRQVKFTHPCKPSRSRQASKSSTARGTSSAIVSGPSYAE